MMGRPYYALNNCVTTKFYRHLRRTWGSTGYYSGIAFHLWVNKTNTKCFKFHSLNTFLLQSAENLQEMVKKNTMCQMWLDGNWTVVLVFFYFSCVVRIYHMQQYLLSPRNFQAAFFEWGNNFKERISGFHIKFSHGIYEDWQLYPYK